MNVSFESKEGYVVIAGARCQSNHGALLWSLVLSLPCCKRRENMSLEPRAAPAQIRAQELQFDAACAKFLKELGDCELDRVDYNRGDSVSLRNGETVVVED